MGKEYVVETLNSLYFLRYEEEGKKLIARRVGSKRTQVCIVCEPSYVGDNMSVEDDCLVLKDNRRIVLRTSKILKCFENSGTIKFDGPFYLLDSEVEFLLSLKHDQRRKTIK